MAKKTKTNARYEENKAAKVGMELICPVCGSRFTKKQWAQAFCCTKCKDTFWNNKGDRHREGYYEDYDLSHPSRLRNRIIYGSSRIAVIGNTLPHSAAAEIEERIADMESTLDQYTDAEIKAMYENRKYGMHPHLTEQTEELFGTMENCHPHPFDLDGQFAEFGF
jgi:uncharacterized Zn finger protein (UPF0148 family)